MLVVLHKFMFLCPAKDFDLILPQSNLPYFEFDILTSRAPVSLICLSSYSDQMSPKDVHVRLHYLNEQYDGGDDTGESSKRKTTCKPHTLSVLETIHDVRGAHEEFSLDLQGFRFIKASTKFKDWTLEQEIRKVLVPEIEDLLRQELESCDEIHVIDIKVDQPSELHE